MTNGTLTTQSSQVLHAPADCQDVRTEAAWELVQRRAKALAASDLVPEQYRGKVPNCLVALEMAHRMGSSPLLVMQNLYIVYGNPSWSSKFLIATLNQSGRFSALRYQFNQDKTSCFAWAVEKSTGERLEGPAVTLAMVKAEGWMDKKGSKWKTMPELMFMYRAAAFFVRLYAPELSMGLRTDDEAHDIHVAQEVKPVLSTLRAALAPKVISQAKQEAEEVEPADPAAPPPDYVTLISEALDKHEALATLEEAQAVLDQEGVAAACRAFATKWIDDPKIQPIN